MPSCAVMEAIETYLPEQQIANSYFVDRLDTSDEWIRTRTGISTRNWVGPNESTSDLAVKAAGRLLDRTGAREQVDLVILSTTTPDHPCPATAPDIAHRLGLREVPAFDIAAVCSGFIYALSAAAAYLTSGQAERVLVIASETYSTILDKSDRTTSVIFGDGAGAVLLRCGQSGEIGSILGFDLGSNGRHKAAIMIPGGGSRSRTSSEQQEERNEFFQMDGRETFSLAVQKMTQSVQKLLGATGWTCADVDRFVAHQANERILKMVAASVGIGPDAVFMNIDRVGNTSSASIPLALFDAQREGKLKAGDKVVLAAFGGGVTWGSAALTWPDIGD